MGASVQDQLRELIGRGRHVAGDLDADRFNRAPRPGSWSVGQCMDHLNEAVRLYLPVLADAVDEGRAAGRLAPPGAPDRTVLGRLITWSQEPPVRFLRMKTFPDMEPGERLDRDETLDAFESLHEELIVRANESADLDGRAIRIRSVVMPRLRLSLGDWYHFLAVHGRRHLWQAERARADLGGP